MTPGDPPRGAQLAEQRVDGRRGGSSPRAGLERLPRSASSSRGSRPLCERRGDLGQRRGRPTRRSARGARRMRREQLPLLRRERREAGADPFRLVEQRLEHQHVAGARERLRVGERRLGRRRRCAAPAPPRRPRTSATRSRPGCGRPRRSSCRSAENRRSGQMITTSSVCTRPPPKHDRARAAPRRRRSVGNPPAISTATTALEPDERRRGPERDQQAAGERRHRRRHDRCDMRDGRRASRRRSTAPCHGGLEHHRGAAAIGALERSESDRDRADRAERARPPAARARGRRRAGSQRRPCSAAPPAPRTATSSSVSQHAPRSLSQYMERGVYTLSLNRRIGDQEVRSNYGLRRIRMD